MVNGAVGAIDEEGQEFDMTFIAFLGFIERAQAFHEGVVDMIEKGNPLAAATLLRSFAENAAAVYYVNVHPHEFHKLHPGAEQGLPMGRVVAAAQKSLPGFKAMHDRLSVMAHPSGAGAFHTLQFQGDRSFIWQSSPVFANVDDAREMLNLLGEIRKLTTGIVKHTADEMRSASQRRRANPA